MSKIITKKRTVASVPFIFFFGALADILFGYDTGIMGIAILYIKKQMHLSPAMQGWAISSMLIGAMVGAAFAGKLADKFGRRRMILVTAVAFGIGAIGAAAAPNIQIILASRLIMGLGVGASSVVVTVYLSEMSPTNKRGSLTALNQLMVTFGILLSYIVGYSFASQGLWRWMVGLALVPSVMVFIGSFFLPETPRWLAKKGFKDSARETLTKIVGESEAEKEFKEMENLIISEKKAKQGNTVFTPKIRLMVFVAAIVALLPQIMGTNSIIYYAPTVLTKIGLGSTAAVLANVSVGALNFIMTFLGIKLIDTAGRKPMLLIGSTGMFLGMLILGIDFSFLNSSMMALIAMLIFIGSQSMSWGVATRIIITEILPLRVRSSVTGYVLILNWGFNFLVGLLFPIVLSSLGSSLMFFIFMIIGAVAFFFVLFLVPETKGRSLEDIEQSMRG